MTPQAVKEALRQIQDEYHKHSEAAVDVMFQIAKDAEEALTAKKPKENAAHDLAWAMQAGEDGVWEDDFEEAYEAIDILTAEVRRLESLQAAQGEVVAEDACEYCDNMGLDCSNRVRLTRPLVRADAHPLPDGAVRFWAEELVNDAGACETDEDSGNCNHGYGDPCKIAKLRAALLSSKPEGAWQPMETAPKDGTHILLFIPTWYERGGFTVGQWNGETFSIYMHEPSHWMPLPQPPAAGGEG